MTVSVSTSSVTGRVSEYMKEVCLIAFGEEAQRRAVIWGQATTPVKLNGRRMLC